MTANLQRVVDEVCSARPDRVLFNGDLAFASGTYGDYAAFRSLISPLRGRGMPVHLTLGNHDHRARFVDLFDLAADAAVTEKRVSSLFIGGVHWLFLDSLEHVNAIRGSLGAEQRAWLARQLDSNAAPAVDCVHHNPERSLVGLKDTEKLLSIVIPRRRVKLVLFGHTHRFRLWQTDGLHFVNLPAVGFRFIDPDAPLGWVWARIEQGRVRLELCQITPRAHVHGATRDLAWRSDK